LNANKVTVALTTIASLAFAAPAGAHVTVQPSEAPAEAFVVEDVRVPNEQEKANTTRVELELPAGFIEASYQPVPGWQAKVTKEKLAKPVKTDEGEVSEQVRRVTWTGGKIAPGQFQDFPLSVQIPGKAGDTLTFKAIQTYDNGDVVRWIGSPGAENPAPQVKVTAASESGAATAAGGGSDDDDTDTLAIIALVVGGLGLLAGAAAIATRRRQM
jgi:periplasmic copper chaperone A